MVGDNAWRTRVHANFRILEGKTSAGSVEPEKGLPINDSGVERRPTNKASEKLRVARVARKIPSIRRENEWSKRWCCGMRGVCLSMIVAKRTGNNALTILKTKK